MTLNFSERVRRRRKLFRPLLEQLEDRRLLAVVTVTGPGDTIAVDGLVTLREAITSANNNANVNADVVGIGVYGTGVNTDTINFNIAGTGVQTISPTSALPTITGPTMVDGYTQPGASANTLAVGNDAVLLVELNGNGIAAEALTISGGGTTMRGLVVNRFSGNAITLQTAGGNRLEGNWMGVGATGDTLLDNGRDIFISNSLNNLIGGTSPAARNVLAGSASNGAVTIFAGAGATIQGNYIGVNAKGSAGLGVGGILVGTGGNLIGGTAAGAGNVIGGTRTLNIGVGIGVASKNTVQGNFFGLSADGTSALTNTSNGITITSAQDNLIGGTTAAARNVLAVMGNAIEIANAGPSGGGNIIQGNYIGTNAAGTAAPVVGGAGVGVLITNGTNNLVGGAAAGAGNLIAGKTGDGILISNGTGNQILGNFIGLAADLTTPLPNLGDGIEISSGTNHRVGGTSAGESNTIAFNGGNGVFVSSGAGYAILANSIRSNTGLGIDLGTNDVTPNDAGDGDTGANNLQNFPVLTAVTTTATATSIQGTLNSTPGGTFRIEFFANFTDDPSCHGEGQTFLGSTNVTTDGDGNVTFSATTADDGLLPIPAGQAFVTATATNTATNDTSELGLNFELPSLVVTTTADVVGNDCQTSLREAILFANAHSNALNPGGVADAITFNIPGSGVKTITPATALPTITDPVVIDGYSQPGASPNTNTTTLGSNAVLLIYLDMSSNPGFGLVVTAGPTTIRGLAINPTRDIGILLNPGSDGTKIEGNFIGTNAAGSAAATANSLANAIEVFSGNNVIGGTTAAARNVISGNYRGMALRGSNNRMEGNLIGTNAAGTVAVPNVNSGVGVYGTANVIGGTTSAARNVISGNGIYGVALDAGPPTTAANLVEGNYIGVDVTGTAALPNGNTGVAVTSSSMGNVIGGMAAGAGNVISGNGSTTSFGLNQNVAVNGSGTLIQGNFIGTNAAGTGAPTGLPAVVTIGIVLGTSAVAGGTGASAGNVIAFNPGVGVLVNDASVQGATILSNSIHSNGQLGIDLGGFAGNGVTPNDTGDGDIGQNNLQNFPVITSVSSSGGNTTIQGTLNSTPTGTFRVEFFANAAADPSGFGEGQTYLGFKSVTTDGSGSATFTATTAADGLLSIPVGQGFVTATATDAGGNTSEFSEGILGNNAPVAQFSQASFSANENSGTAVITVTRTGDPAVPFTIDFTTSNGTAAAGADYTANSGTLSFGAGEMSKTFTVAILDDAAVEGDETVSLVLQNPTGGAVLGTPVMATLTIVDNDMAAQPAGQLAFSAATFTVSEGGGTATITVTRTGGSAGPVSVSLNTSDGTAATGSDYNGILQQVTWADGETATKTITIPIVQDSVVEGNETVNLRLSSPTGGAVLGVQSTAVLTIVDDDISTPGKGSITGRVFHDFNANGVENDGEPPLSGMTIFLDTDNDGRLDPGEASFHTGSNGQYTFANLDPGNYVVRQDYVPDHGIVSTSAPALSLILSSGANLTGTNFANVLISQVSPVEAAADRFPVSADIETAYVHGLYVNVLHREPEPGALTGWVGLLKSNSNTLAVRQEVVNQFWQSPEHRGLQVDHFYATYLHRAAEAEGRAFHVQQFLSHASEAVVVNGFLQSAEYQKAHGTDSAFVAELYADVLSRSAQAGELAAGVQQLQSVNRSDFARSLIESDESYLRIVDSYYVAYLHRPAEDGGRNFWLNLLRGGQPPEEARNAISDNSPGGLALQFLSGDVRIQEYVLAAQESVR